MSKTIEELSTAPTRINLRREFPRPLRSIVRRSFCSIVMFLIVIIVTSFLDSSARAVESRGATLDMLQLFCMAMVILFALGAAIHVAFEICYYIFYEYVIELDHLVITKGLFFRARASVPLAQITDASLRRGPIDLVFALYDMRILTSSPMSDMTTIDNMSPKNAVGLQNRLLSLIETTTPPVDELAAAISVATPELEEQAELLVSPPE